MSDELFLNGKTYVSSKRAAELSEYAQDYIGQLSRGGLIDSQRVGGLWYVSMESLLDYKKNADDYKPVLPSIAPQQDPQSLIFFDGKDYVSASRAAKITGYNQDYVGQLARKGAILSRQIGNRWYIERQGLLDHKKAKDAMLASVQREAVGLPPVSINLAKTDNLQSTKTHFTYTADTRELLPDIKKPFIAVEDVPSPSQSPSPYSIPIRVVHAPPSASRERGTARTSVRTRGQTISYAAKSAFALTIVIMLSFGLFSLRDSSVYTSNFMKNVPEISGTAFAAGAASSLSKVGDMLERWFVPELTYERAR